MGKTTIAILGARGIANYGGYETFVREIAFRLSEEGYEIYCSSEKDGNLEKDGNFVKKYNGINLTYFPIKMPKNYGIPRKIMHVLYKMYFAVYFSVYKKCDVVYFLGDAQSIFTVMPRLFGKLTLVNMGGVEWERSKFNRLEKFIDKTNFKIALICSDHTIIDNTGLAKYVDERYHKKLMYIPYGVDIDMKNSQWNEKTVKKYVKDDFEVYPNDYWLVVTRLSPDNNVHLVLESFINSKTEKPLIVVGSLSSSESYCSQISKVLEQNKDKKIIFTGGIYDQNDLNMFRTNCFGYIHAHSIGGTNPSLLEAMFLKNIIIAHDNEFNREVAGNTALYFADSDDLQDKIERVEADYDKDYDKYSKLKDEAYQRVKKEYSWDKIVDEYESMFKECYDTLNERSYVGEKLDRIRNAILKRPNLK